MRAGCCSLASLARPAHGLGGASSFGTSLVNVVSGKSVVLVKLADLVHRRRERKDRAVYTPRPVSCLEDPGGCEHCARVLEGESISVCGPPRDGVYIQIR